jgi:branched-subunit amino acid aminotransferase/4-amino-4-deoxychorismate lyase
MRHLDPPAFLAELLARRQPWQTHYHAMYSSLLDAVVTDPALMLLPVDDHLVHRGDGVFDAAKCLDGRLYNFDAHLARLLRSAAALRLSWPGGADELARLTRETIRAGGRRTCSVRLLLGRGPGSFSASPGDSAGASLHIVAHTLHRPFMEERPAGARVRRSRVPPKPPPLARVKHCNYLQNAMMKQEALDWEVDFTLGFDAAGHLTEGPTENAGIVTRDGELLFPRLDGILAGTTMARVMELAETLVAEGVLNRVAHRHISEEDILRAEEMLVTGTTLDVVAVVEYEGRPVGSGRPGAVHARLSRLLEEDMTRNEARLTPVF